MKGLVRQVHNLQMLLCQVKVLQQLCRARTMLSMRSKSTHVCAPNQHGLDGNPLDLLNDCSQVPVVPPESYLFKPSAEDIKKAQELFSKKQRHLFKVHKGVVNAADLPDHRQQEVAFVGRSNVGKSSLIAALYQEFPAFNRAISKSPGYTKIIKIYEMQKKFSLVDLPGYGFNMPAHFVDTVEAYLQTRHNVNRIFLLVDAEVGLTTADQTGLEMLQEFSRPFTIILTKQDKGTPHKILRNIFSIRRVIEHHPTCFPQPFLVSAHTGAGLAYLRTYIAYTTGNLHIDGL